MLENINHIVFVIFFSKLKLPSQGVAFGWYWLFIGLCASGDGKKNHYRVPHLCGYSWLK
jgi:hypothetical protein